MQLRLEKDIKKIEGQVTDLQHVPFSSELRQGLQDHLSDMKVAHSAFEQWLLSERSCDDKKAFLSQLQEETKPALNAMKEAGRRIKSSGMGKGDSEIESIASGRSDVAKLCVS